MVVNLYNFFRIFKNATCLVNINNQTLVNIVIMLYNLVSADLDIFSQLF